MIVGLGVDIVEVDRMARLHARFRDRLAVRILSPAERPEYDTATDPARLLAKRFAVKEAAAKALGTGIGGRVSFHDITLDHGATGVPVLRLSGGAREHADRIGVTAQHVTLADESASAVAMVILESSGS